MTHPETIETLIGLRAKRVSCGDSYTAKAAELYRRADEAYASAASFLTQGADFSEILRQVDREHAGDYPDPRKPADAVVVELRAIASLIERTGLPDAGFGVNIQLNIHGVDVVVATTFAEAVLATVEKPAFKRRDRFIGVEYSTAAPGVDVEYALYLTPQSDPKPKPEPKLTPDEVADAFETSAEYGRQVTAPLTVAVAGAAERAALLEEHAADVAVADELERQGREIDDEVGPFWPGANPGDVDPVDDDGEADMARHMDALDDAARAEQAGGCRPAQSDDEDEPLDDDAPTDAEPDESVPDPARVPVSEGDRVRIVRGQHRGRFGHVVSSSGAFWRYVELEAGPSGEATTVRAATGSIIAAPLDADPAPAGGPS